MCGKGGVRVDRLLSAPLEATWVVTSRCNLRCPYCLEDPLPADAPDDASEEARELIIRQLIENEILKVYISGGEPLLVPSVPGYVKRFRDMGMAVRLTTNGTLIDEEMAERLSASRLTAAEVSLHPGALDSVRRAVSLLVARGVRTILRIVVTPRNCSRLEGLVSPFVGSGVENVSLQEVAPLGRAACQGESLLGLDSLRAIREEIDGMRKKWGEGFVGFSSTTLAEAEAGHPVPCTLSLRLRKGCEVRPDGNVIPCAPASAYGVRNLISEKGLRACWRDLPRLYAPFAEEPPGGRCERCRWAKACGGGCRAVSFLLSGKASAGNPVCPFFQPRSVART